MWSENSLCYAWISDHNDSGVFILFSDFSSQFCFHAKLHHVDNNKRNDENNAGWVWAFFSSWIFTFEWRSRITREVHKVHFVAHFRMFSAIYFLSICTRTKKRYQKSFGQIFIINWSLSSQQKGILINIWMSVSYSNFAISSKVYISKFDCFCFDLLKIFCSDLKNIMPSVCRLLSALSCQRFFEQGRKEPKFGDFPQVLRHHPSWAVCVFFGTAGW